MIGKKFVCNKGFEVQVCVSPAGFYIGTLDDHMPNCRISGYYNSREIAQHHIDENDFLMRYAPENLFCGCVDNRWKPDASTMDETIERLNL